MYYSSANRDRIKEAHPGCTSGKVSKFLDAEWRAMGAEGQAPYEMQAADHKARYTAELKAYEELTGHPALHQPSPLQCRSVELSPREYSWWWRNGCSIWPD